MVRAQPALSWRSFVVPGCAQALPAVHADRNNKISFFIFRMVYRQAVF
jgi:hypothetical protein